MSTKLLISLLSIILTSFLLNSSAVRVKNTPKSCKNENFKNHKLPVPLDCQKPLVVPLPPTPLLPALQTQLLKFLDQRLAVVYPVIQNFKSTITSDPFGITKTWVGSNICTYKGFFCDNPPDNKSAISVASIDFNGFQLSAPSLNGFLDQLPDIALFHANSNFFSGNNQLNGPLPLALACLEKVEQLNFAGNLLSVGPWCRVLIAEGVLDVRNNCIPDLPFQRSVMECAEFYAQPKFCPGMWSYSYIPCKPSFSLMIPEMAPSP
ncbi:uncharacterized protein At4g06744-like isoform X4 [Mercurialis annua]|uniref:uncharacterized protein At4g06744-like isoform X4 n=1 Tax=Mercurialis annua TaxID=3986 RepID=UPI0024AF23C8|nr:uncharacterized protein At4g06744-like isoform X4 [Mercurialis annua]